MRRSLLLLVVGIPLVLGPAESQERRPQPPRRCDPSYPDFCIPPPPPDLDCRHIPLRQRPFRVRQPDPHHFDQNKNGLGCENQRRRS